MKTTEKDHISIKPFFLTKIIEYFSPVDSQILYLWDN